MARFRSSVTKRLLLTGALLAGAAEAAAQDELHFTRLNSNGSVDTGFGGNGHSFRPVPGNDPSAWAREIVPTSNGKYLFAGRGEVGTSTFMVGRLNANGTIDTSFSNDGFASATFAGSSDSVAAALISMSGQAVVVGSANDSFAVARFTTTGSLDNMFGTGGKVEIAFPGSAASATGVAEQANGKIIVAGWLRRLPQPDLDEQNLFAVARLKTDGSLDTTFGDGGRTLIAFGEMDAQAFDVGVLTSPPLLQDFIALGGTVVTSGGDRMAVALLKPDGTLEPGFDGDGKRLISFPNSTASRGAALEIDGSRIVISGDASFALDRRMAVARLSPTGPLDLTFSGDGMATLDTVECQGMGSSGLAIAPDRGVALAGSCVFMHPGGFFEMVGLVARWAPNGDLLTSFSGGAKIIDVGGPENYFLGATFFPNDKLVLSGSRIPAP